MRPLLLLLCLSQVTLAASAVEQVAEEGSGLPGWRWEDTVVSFTFNQRLPDQTRAFFQGRGFLPEQAEPLAHDCVFQAIIRNSATAATPMEIDLAQWRVIPDAGAAQPLRLESQWQQEWEQRRVAEAARIAFRWSLFPTRQTFEPGDWNMGMITLGLPPGSRFELDVVWRAGNQILHQRFPGMHCAAAAAHQR